MNKLEDFFYNNPHKHRIHKWAHYFEIYDRHFKKFMGRKPVILEIGVYGGGSLEMWNHYFDGDCQIYGVDIDPNCQNLLKEHDNIHILIGDQEDREFWKKIKLVVPKFDIIIDDGGHMMMQQIVTFEETYDHMNDDGVYLCEDVHTSYWPEYGGGLKRDNTFIEYSKNFIDMLNSWHIANHDKTFRMKTHSVHYYDSICVLEKRLDTSQPKSIMK